MRGKRIIYNHSNTGRIFNGKSILFPLQGGEAFGVQLPFEAGKRNTPESISKSCSNLRMKRGGVVFRWRHPSLGPVLHVFVTVVYCLPLVHYPSETKCVPVRR